MKGKIGLILFFCLCLGMSVHSQIHLKGYRGEWVDSSLYERMWPARWIAYPGDGGSDYGVYHFRKTFQLERVPQSLVAHVSADNRYKLYVNGQLVSMGPARGDVYNWNFETVDLAPFLRAGRNVVASVVWNYAERRPAAQMSLGQAGFLLQGNLPADSVVNTDTTWLCLKDKAYAPWTEWQVLGYYVAGPGEELEAADYPWGWESIDYDDSHWERAAMGLRGAMKGARDYPGRQLVPSPIPPMETRIDRLREVRLADGVEAPAGFLAGKERLVIPRGKSVRLLLDHGALTTGYFNLLFSGGKGADIRVNYAEALYKLNPENPWDSEKNHRDELEGKTFLGYGDRILPDGGERRLFTTLWWRTWRYVELLVTTKEDDLYIDDLYGLFSAYPFENVATFSAPGHEDLNRMLEIGWRTARLCAHETYMDCPYYEQLQYFGDTRIQAMISLYNTRDSFMVKNALEKGRQSMVADGLTMSRYPSYIHQFISSFSLWWINMGHDYWMYRGDEAYVKTLLPAYRNILSWYEQWLKPDYSLAYVPYWFFADWADGFEGGEPIREKSGDSAFQDLLYLLTLEAAASMENAMGMPALATRYMEIASKIRDTFRAKYWTPEKTLFADTRTKKSFSQHVNALAILAGMTEGEEAQKVMTRTLADTTLVQATIYFRYYVHQALKKSGLGDQLLDNLQIWRDQMALGLTTWAEQPEPSRSDCHAWSSSPNVEFYRTILGIESMAPGFKEIRIAPALGALKNVSGSMPHPAGEIKVAYQIDASGQGQAKITLPAGTKGLFIWKNRTYPLEGGEQELFF